MVRNMVLNMREQNGGDGCDQALEEGRWVVGEGMIRGWGRGNDLGSEGGVGDLGSGGGAVTWAMGEGP